MKKSYLNPAAKTADVRIRTILLAGSQTVDLDSKEQHSGTPDNPEEADVRMRRVGASSLD